MEALKQVFQDKALTYEELMEALKSNQDVKLANLAEGRYVDRDKYEGKVRELGTANDSIKTLTEKLKAFDGIDVEGLKNDVKGWEAKYKKDIAQVKKDAAVDAAILQAKGRNPKAIKALLDMDSISLKDDGTLAGLDLDRLKKSDGYLFDVEETVQRGTGVREGNQQQTQADGMDVFVANMRAAAGLKD